MTSSSAALTDAVARRARPEPVCRVAAGPAERAAHPEVRRRGFVAAQGLFAGDDRDARDDDPATLHAVAVVEGAVVGAVRLYPLDAAGLWKGDRLAVLPEARDHRLGAELVRFAVRTAGARGGGRMLAQIQLPNVRFFEHLGWEADGPAAPYHGVIHQPMAIALRAPDR
jgi:putative N-acetyltransferase (TIGR04045 family)